jgi:hypothetical protein
MLPNCDNSAAQDPEIRRGCSAAAAENLDIEVADFLPQRIAVEP